MLLPLINCQKCKLHLTRKLIVNGKGPLDADILFFGEGPGQDEDMQGDPFVGEAGVTLTQILFDARIPRPSVFIDNMVRCRPPNNRTPEIGEIRACLARTIEVINYIKPKMIVALGETAAMILAGNWKGWRGSVTTCVLPGINIPVLITYHPAYALPYRNPDAYALMVHDLGKIKALPEDFIEDYRHNPPLGYVEDLLFHKWVNTPVAIDLEASPTRSKEEGGEKDDALDPWKGEITGVGFCGEPGVAFTLTDIPMYFPLIKRFFESPTPKVFQNAPFDRYYTRHKWKIDIKNTYWDTMDTMHVMNPDAPKKLDHLRSLYTSKVPYKTHYRTAQGYAQGLTQDKLAELCSSDADTTLRVSYSQATYLSSNQEKLRQRHIKLQDLAIDMRTRGVLVDKEAIAKLYLKHNPVQEKIEEEFYQKTKKEITSNKQCSDLFYNEFLLPLPPYHGGKKSVDKSAIKHLMKCSMPVKHKEIVTLKQDYQENINLLNTFIIGVFKQIRSDGRVHGVWNPTGADTGRWACSAPNMMNPPKSTRHIYIVPEGMELWGFDYARIELLILAILSGEDGLRDNILSGGDPHNDLLLEVQKYSPWCTRTQVKALLFGVAYGIQARTVANTFDVTIKIAETWMQIAINQYPKVLAMKEKFLQDWERQRYLESLFGRRKYCKTPNEALNFPIQSPAADVAHNAAMNLNDAGFPVILNMHDFIGAEVDPNKHSWEEFKTIAEHPCNELSPFFPIDAKRGKNWMEVT